MTPTAQAVSGRWAAAVGAIAAVLFFGIASVHIESPGPYYDELHQAPAAFHYVGSQTRFFSPVTIAGIPVTSFSYTATRPIPNIRQLRSVNGAPVTLM